MAARTRKVTPAVKAIGPPKRRGVAPKPKPAARSAEKPEVRIFVSYSHQDAGAQDRLNTHLAPWQRDGVVIWYDENIEPGAELNGEIASELRRAHIFIALFSPAYLASNYCWDIEYKRAMSRRARKLMRVVAVVVRPCAWKQTRAAGFKLLPKDGLPPERWSSNDAAYVNAAEGIGEVIKAVRRELVTKPRKPSRAFPRVKPAKPRPTPGGPASTGTGKVGGAPNAKSGTRPRKAAAKK